MTANRPDDYSLWMIFRPLALISLSLVFVIPGIFMFLSAQADQDVEGMIIAGLSTLFFGAMLPVFLWLPVRVRLQGGKILLTRLYGRRQIDLTQAYRLISTGMSTGGGQYVFEMDGLDETGRPYRLRFPTGAKAGSKLLPRMIDSFAHATGGDLDKGAMMVLGASIEGWQLPASKGWPRQLPLPHSPGFNAQKFWLLVLLSVVLIAILGGLGWLGWQTGHDDWPLPVLMAAVIVGIGGWQGLKSWRNRLLFTETELITRSTRILWQQIREIHVEGDDILLRLADGEQARLARPSNRIPATLIAAQIQAMLPRRGGWQQGRGS